MCDTVFSFGPGGGYYFESPSKWVMSGLPSTLQALFNENKVARTYCVALGSDDSFVVTYKAKASEWSYPHCDGVPKALQDWLYEDKESDSGTRVSARQLYQVRVSLGPSNASFFATDGKSWMWENLPASLCQAIRERYNDKGQWLSEAQTPRLVVLGAQGNYALITHGGGGQWSLGAYSALEEMLNMLSKTEEKFAVIKNLALDPHRPGVFVLQLSRGVIWPASVPPIIAESLRSMEKAVEDDNRAEELRQLEARVAAERGRLEQRVGQLTRLNRQAEDQRVLDFYTQSLLMQQRTYNQSMNRLADTMANSWTMTNAAIFNMWQ